MAKTTSKSRIGNKKKKRKSSSSASRLILASGEALANLIKESHQETRLISTQVEDLRLQLSKQDQARMLLLELYDTVRQTAKEAGVFEPAKDTIIWRVREYLFGPTGESFEPMAVLREQSSN